MGWQPILDGDLREHARATIVEIARALARGEGEPCKPTDETLFWAYVAGELDEPWVQDAYDRAVERLVEEAQGGFGDDISLYHGAAGAGFVIAHVSEPELVEDSLAAIDAAIEERLASTPEWSEPYDLIDGLVGVGMYLLERTERSEAASRALTRVVDHLWRRAEVRDEGTAWFTPANELIDDQRALFPDGCFNCGLAHGIPGIVSFLARVAGAQHAARTRARALACDGYRWLVAQRLPPGPRSCFPAWVGRERQGKPTRTAWCYGDPGVVTALWDAACQLGLPTDDIVDVARIVAARAPESTGVIDAALCHGAAGLAHICNRWFQASGDETFRVAGRAWFERTLASRRPDGVAGFAAWSRNRGSPLAWIPRTMFLEGITGIGLALLAACSDVEPAWDRLLAVDLR